MNIQVSFFLPYIFI